MSIIPWDDTIIDDQSMPLVDPADFSLIDSIEWANSVGLTDLFLLGDDADSLVGIKGVKTLVPQAASHVFHSNYVTVETDQNEALETDISDANKQAMMMVVRRPDTVAANKNVLLMGSIGATAGSGMYATSGGLIAGVSRNLGSSPVPSYPAGVAVGDWMFLLYVEDFTLAAGSKLRRAYIGSEGVLSSAESLQDTAKTLSGARKIAIGNNGYAHADFNGGPAIDVAAFATLTGTPTTVQVAKMFFGIRVLLAARGVTV